MNKLMLMGGAAALMATVGCSTFKGGPAFEQMQWEPTAFDSGVWTIDKDGVMTASKDAALWSAIDYENFILDFDYKLEPAANSGVVIYATNPANWIPSSIEIQLLDDNHERWKKDAAYLKNSSLYGHLAPLATPAKPAGEWNHMTVTAKGQRIQVELNGVKTIDADISVWKNAKQNPDGTKIPSWLSTPWATIPTIGRIGFQGMHGGAKPYFRNVRVATIPNLQPYTDGASARTAAYRAQKARAAQLANESPLLVDSGTVTSEQTDFFPDETPKMAFAAAPGKKVCCKWNGTLTLACSLVARETVTHYTVASANDAPARDPSAWELYASDDGKTWTLVDKRENVSFVSRHNLQCFDLAKPVTARQFKLVVQKNKGDSLVQLAQVTFRK